MTESEFLTAVQNLLRGRLDCPVHRLASPDIGESANVAHNALFKLEIDGRSRELRVDAKLSFSSADADQLVEKSKRARGWLLAARDLSPRMRAQLRENRLNYVDLTGNIFIREPGLYIWLEADRKPPPRKLWEVHPLNPFSKKASLVIRALLEHPAKPWQLRELTAETKLSVGHTSDITRELVRRGYAHEKGGRISLKNAVAALRDWTAAYRWTRNAVSSFVVPFDYDELTPELTRVMDAEGIQFALTMLAGAERLAPHARHGQMHVYVPAEQVEQAEQTIREALYGEDVRGGGTLHLMRPYHGEGAFYGAREVDGMRTVSPVQLFIDLAGYPLRGAEAARMLALGALADQLGLDRNQVHELTKTLE